MIKFRNLKIKYDPIRSFLKSRGGGLRAEERTKVEAILSQWKSEQGVLRTSIETLIPDVARDVIGDLGAYYEISGTEEEFAHITRVQTPFTQAVSKRILKDTQSLSRDLFSGKPKKEEKAQRAQDTVSELCALEEHYPALGRAVVASLASLRATLAQAPADASPPSTTAEMQQPEEISPSKPMSESAGKALALIKGDPKNALTMIHGHSTTVASDLVELKESHPELVRKFWRSLEKDARAELFDGGLSNEFTSSLFLPEPRGVAQQIRRQSREHYGTINALSSLILLVEEAEEALETVHVMRPVDSEADRKKKEQATQEAEKRFGHVLGVFAALGYEKACALAERDYTGGSGDSGHAEAGRESVTAFLHHYEDGIRKLGRKLRRTIKSFTQAAPSQADVASTETAIDDRVRALSEQEAGKVIEEAKSAFQDVPLEE